jgi:hypothetical protein
MPARLCRSCAISYPGGSVECPVCGQTTIWNPDAEPDSNWEDRVDNYRALHNPEGKAVRAWRERRLTRMGFTGWGLDVLADIPEVWLRDVEALLERGCPHDTAARILL